MNLVRGFNMTPFEIRREKAREVLLFTRRLHELNKYEDAHTTPDGRRIIRRPAGDSWF